MRNSVLAAHQGKILYLTLLYEAGECRRGGSIKVVIITGTVIVTVLFIVDVTLQSRRVAPRRQQH